MTLKPHAPQIRTQTRTRRLSVSACYLHPTDTTTGICASCLRERLSGLDSPAHPEPSSSTAAFITHLANGNALISSSNKTGDPSPELRRCRSVVVGRCDASATFTEPRRNSCDVRARNGSTLANLFDIDDEYGRPNAESKLETKNIFSGAAIELREEIGDINGEENRDFRGVLQVANAIDDDDDDGDVEDGEIKTMKEYIDLELTSKSQKSKDFKELAGNFWGAASLFSKKLQKWRQKQKAKKLSCSNETNSRKGKHLGETQSELAEYAMGRRSCDTEPRFSIDAGRLSMDCGRISVDEPRASWDGYMIARTIPRLTPMLSVVDNGMLGGGNRFDNHRSSVDGQMHSIMEDETSSGGSGQSNSDSSSSQRRSSFDRSSSVRSFGKRIVGLEGDEMKYVSKAIVSPAKLVITERELKDWHLSSVKDDDHLENMEKFGSDPKDAIANPMENGGNLGSKKPLRWRKVWNTFGLKQKSCERKCENLIGNAVECLVIDACEKQQKQVNGGVKDTTDLRLMRSSSIVSSRQSSEVRGSDYSTRSAGNDFDCANNGMEEFVLGRNQSSKYASSNFDSTPLPFYLTPLRSSRRKKSGKNNSLDSNCNSGNVLQLN